MTSHTKTSSQLRLMLALALSMTMGPLLAAELPGESSQAPLDKNSTARFEQMPKVWLSSPAFWMDDSHLIFSSSDANANWHLGDLPKIVILDTATRKIEPTNYVGYLYCYSAKRMIVDAGSRAGKPIVLEGVFGQPLKEIAGHFRPKITGIDCATVALDDDVVTIALRPGDGKIRYSSGSDNVASESYDVEFLTDDGRRTGTAHANLRTLPGTNRFVFLPWSGEYAKEGAIGAQQSVGGSLVDPKSQTITPILAPEPLADLANANKGSADVLVTKPGPLWRFRTYRGRHEFQGLYLQTSANLLRLDNHDVWLSSDVSSDGCKLFYGRVAGDRFAPDPFKNRDNYDVVLLNVCKGGK